MLLWRINQKNNERLAVNTSLAETTEKTVKETRIGSLFRKCLLYSVREIVFISL